MTVKVNWTFAVALSAFLCLLPQISAFVVSTRSARPKLLAVRDSASQRRCRRAMAGLAKNDADALDEDDGRPARISPRAILARPWDVEVAFHGETHVITVQPGDSILEAAEMAGMNLSYDCRRGSCITCAARVQDGSSRHFDSQADRRAEDGAPEGFILTCSTRPTGPGVKLELSANAEMWAAFCERFDDAHTRDLLRQASAGLMRKYRMEHPEEFRREVERQFEAPQE